MTRRDRPALRLIVILVVLPTLVIVFLVVRYQINEHSSRNALASEFDTLGPPKGCKEEKRVYGRGGIDVASRWTVFYSCATTGGQIYDSITDQLIRRGYAILGSPATPGKTPPISYYFGAESNKFYVNYLLKPLSGIEPYKEETLRTARVTSIDFEIRRAVPD